MPTAMSPTVRVFGAPRCIEERFVVVPDTGEMLVKVLVSGVNHVNLRAAAGN